jgi:ABC-type glutathione transport system ATPase component
LEEVDRVVLLRDGQIVASGSYESVKETPEYKKYLIAALQD